MIGTEIIDHKMRVLFALPHCPIPVDAGAKQLTLQAIEAVAAKHEVAFVVLRGGSTIERVDELRHYGPLIAVSPPHRRSMLHRLGYRATYLLFAVLKRAPLHSFYGCPADFWRAVLTQVDRWRPDIIHYDFWYSAIRDNGNIPCCRILLEQDVEFVRRYRQAALASPAQRWWLRRVARVIQRAESRVLQDVDCVMTVTASDAAAAEQAGARRVQIFPVSVDTERLCPPPVEPATANILFVGSFTHIPNVDGIQWFVKNVFPLVRQAHPSARLTIVGANPPPSVRELAEKWECIDVVGWVNDLGPFYSSSRVVVAPLRFGAGIKTKVLEAMAFGRPVVTTTVGAEGTGLTPEKNVFVEDAAEGFAEAVSLLLGHPEQARAIGLAGRSFVEEYYGKRSASVRILQIYENELKRATSI